MELPRHNAVQHTEWHQKGWVIITSQSLPPPKKKAQPTEINWHPLTSLLIIEIDTHEHAFEIWVQNVELPEKACCFFPTVGVMLMTGTTSPSTNALAHCFMYDVRSSRLPTLDVCKGLNHLSLWLWVCLVCCKLSGRCWWMKGGRGMGFPGVCGGCDAWVATLIATCVHASRGW